jgi:hypothetical protein
VSTTLATIRDQTTRHGINADLTYLASFFGQQHTFKGGYSWERIGENELSNYTNGRFQVYWGQPFSRASITNVNGIYGYYTWEDGVRVDSNVHGRNQGFYLQDDWRIHPRVTLNIGVRLENEYIPPYLSSYQGYPVDNPISFGWGAKIVPRLGGVWDITGNGKWKLSGSFGYFTDIIKYNLASGSFGGQVCFTHVYQLNNPNVLSPPGGFAALHTQRHHHRNRGQSECWIQREAKSISSGTPGMAPRDTNSVYGQKTPNGKEFLVPKATRQYDGVEFRVK